MAPELTPLSDAEIAREAELIVRAISLRVPGDDWDILLRSRELSERDEDRVIRALEEMERAGLA